MPLAAARCLVLAGVLACLWGGAAKAQAERALCARSALGIPAREAQARGASQFIASLAGLGERERDRAIRDELLAGNLPGFLRHAWPASWSVRLADGRSVRLTLCVLSDYLSLGSDQDHLRVPLGLPSALAVAASFGFTLPTRRVVDEIYRLARVHLVPQPLPAGEEMRSTAYAQRHQALVEQQRRAVGAGADELTAGHKKDLVLSPRLLGQPGRVAIYGWQRADGSPIQPLSTVHGAGYADYSHGVRLVHQTAFVDGRPVPVFQLLGDRALAGLLSDEGPLPRVGDWQRERAAE